MAKGPALVISSVQQVCVGVLLENSALQAMPLEPANGKQCWLVPHHCCPLISTECVSDLGAYITLTTEHLSLV